MGGEGTPAPPSTVPVPSAADEEAAEERARLYSLLRSRRGGRGLAYGPQRRTSLLAASSTAKSTKAASALADYVSPFVGGVGGGAPGGGWDGGWGGGEGTGSGGGGAMGEGRGAGAGVGGDPE